ncbi:MAG: cold-shock protein [Anaerolineae bacterium]
MPPPTGDTYLVCCSCRTSFLYTAAERQAAVGGGGSLPDRCPACAALDRLTRRHSGRLESYDRRRGFGFIRDDDGTAVFVHASALGVKRGAIPKLGMRLTFVPELGERGPRAIDVLPVEL